jgi:hypothetical protein
VREWADDVSQWQKALADLYDAETSQMEEAARQVEQGGDPALIERLNVVRQLDPTEPEFRYSGGGRHGRSGAAESRLAQPAPRVTPDPAGPGPAGPGPAGPGPAGPGPAGPGPDPGSAWSPVPDQRALAVQPSAPSPTRPDADGFDPYLHSEPAGGGGRHAAPSRLEFSDAASQEESTGTDGGGNLVASDGAQFAGFTRDLPREDLSAEDETGGTRPDPDHDYPPADDDGDWDEPAV